MDAWLQKIRRISTHQLSVLFVAIVVVTSVSGCSVFVMLGKMFYGDPLIPSEFRSRTRINLAKQDTSLLVVCTTPESVSSELPALQFDLTEGILRRMKRNGIKIVNPDKVADWVDNNGSQVGTPREMAQDFDAGFIVVIDVERFDTTAEKSPHMYQGKSFGNVVVYQVIDDELGKRVQSIYSGEFRTTYPPMNPISQESMERRVFQKRFMDHLADQLARQFHDYRLGDEF